MIHKRLSPVRVKVKCRKNIGRTQSISHKIWNLVIFPGNLVGHLKSVLLKDLRIIEFIFEKRSEIIKMKEISAPSKTLTMITRIYF